MHGESQQCAIYHCAVRGRTTVCFMKEKCCIAYIKRAVAVCRLTLWGNKVFIKISITVYGYGRGLKKYWDWTMLVKIFELWLIISWLCFSWLSIERLRDSRPQICGHCHKTADQKNIEPFSCDSGQIFGICTY